MQESNSTLHETLSEIAAEVQESDMQEFMDMQESVATVGIYVSMLGTLIVEKFESNTLPLELKPVYKQLIRAFGDTMQPMRDFINKTEQYVKNQMQ